MHFVHPRGRGDRSQIHGYIPLGFGPIPTDEVIPMTAMFRITLPDGSVREVAPGTTAADIAAAIGPGLAKAAIAARVDGELRDLSRPLPGRREPCAGDRAR